MSRHPRIMATLLACVLPLAACSAAEGLGPNHSGSRDPSGAIFLASRSPADVYPDALFVGRVTLDEQGCLRADGPDRHTLVWPYGYALESRGGELYVRDASGRQVGRIGGEFRLGGGETTDLSVARLSAESHSLAAARCPGRYWIASPS